MPETSPTELKCDHCGATLDPVPNGAFLKCPYCGTVYEPVAAAAPPPPPPLESSPGASQSQIAAMAPPRTRWISAVVSIVFVLVIVAYSLWSVGLFSSPLNVSVSAIPSSGTHPLTVSFKSSVSGGSSPYTYYWTSGAGGYSYDANPQFTFPSRGAYAVTLTVTDSRDKSQSATTTVIVDPVLTASPVTQVQNATLLSGMRNALSYQLSVPSVSASDPSQSVNVSVAGQVKVTGCRMNGTGQCNQVSVALMTVAQYSVFNGGAMPIPFWCYKASGSACQSASSVTIQADVSAEPATTMYLVIWNLNTNATQTLYENVLMYAEQ